MTSQLTDTARAFPGATCGADVVPGRPERVYQVAEQLAELSDGLLRLAAVLRGLNALDWHGLARRAMDGVVSSDAEPVARAGALMAQSADHLRGHARVLAAAQARADDAVRLDARVAQVVTLDDAAALRAVAVREVAQARAAVRSSAALAAGGLHAAAALAPVEPGLLGRQVAAARARARGVAAGAVEAQIGLLALAVRFGGPRALADPGGWAADAGAVTRSSLALLAHPRQAAAEALDVDTWKEDRWRWAGRQTVALALGSAGGAATLAGTGARAATVPARVLAAAPTPRGAALRLAVRERPAVGRSPLRAADVRPFSGAPSALGTVSRLPPVPHAVGAAALRDAAWAERTTTPRVEAVAERLGAVRVGQGSVLKGAESMHRKLGDELRSQPARSPVAAASRVDDTVRYTLVFPAEHYVAGAVRTVQGLRDEGFDLARAKSTWGGTRYQGVNLVLQDQATGRLVEVQVHTPGSWDATVRTHRDYELYRDERVDPVLKQHLQRAIGAEYARVPRPAGVEHLRDALAALGSDVPPVSGPGRLPYTDPWAPVRQGLAGALASPGVGVVVLPDPSVAPAGAPPRVPR